MAKTFTVTITDAEEKAFAWDIADPEDWVENAVKNKCRKAKDRLYEQEVKRMTDDDDVSTIPADKDTVINNAVVQTAKQRQNENHPKQRNHMSIEVTSDDVIAVMRERFSNELTICIQAVQIEKLQELKCTCLKEEEEKPEDDS